jgi:inner membrane protein
MDNLTHTLVGVLVGETVAHCARPAADGLSLDDRRTMYVTVMAVGSNFPDLDLLYTLSGGTLAYLLHHRGHTHTVIAAFIAAVLLYAACEFWIRRRGLHVVRTDRLGLIGVALLAPLLHIAMDSTNSYGVHPFWPLHNGWVYGDSVFIIEPLLWASVAPLAMILRTRWARSLIFVVLIGGIALSVFTQMVPPWLVGVLTAVTLLLLWIARRSSARTALLAGVSVWIAVTLMFMTASHHARARLSTFVAQQLPHMQQLDHVLTPMPVNPLCWEALLVLTEADRYSLRRAMLSLAPSLLPAARCPSRSLDVETTVPLAQVNEPDSAFLQWHGQIVMSRQVIATLVTTNCQAAAFMRFARAPWVMTHDSGWRLGDLRYDREAELGFAEIEIKNEDLDCPTHVPPWLPPREDLLEGDEVTGDERMIIRPPLASRQ